MDSTDEAAAAISKAIQEVARRARSEEDLRIGIEEALAGVREELGVLPRYERSYSGGSVSVFGGGSSDAVYGHAIIEYKRPGRLSKPRDLREATAQLKGYMYCEAEQEGVDIEKGLRRIIGIGLDGQCIFFLRYRAKRAPKISPTALLPGTQPTLFDATAQPEGFQLLGPYPVSTETIAQFLLYLRALHRRPLTPEALAEEFGPRGGVASDVVATLYNRLFEAVTNADNPFPKAAISFSEWDRIFGIVYGQDITKAKEDAVILAKLYGLAEGVALKPLLFAVHTYMRC